MDADNLLEQTEESKQETLKLFRERWEQESNPVKKQKYLEDFENIRDILYTRTYEIPEPLTKEYILKTQKEFEEKNKRHREIINKVEADLKSSEDLHKKIEQRMLYSQRMKKLRTKIGVIFLLIFSIFYVLASFT